MAATSETIPYWQLISLSNSDGVGNPLADVVASVAFFLLLRWAEHQDRQEEAFADFENFAYTPKIPRELGWRRILDVFDNHSRYESIVSKNFERETLADEIVPHLCNIGGNPLADTIAQAAYCYDPRKLSWNLLQKSFDFVNSLVIETTVGREEANAIFDVLVEEAVGKTRFSGQFFTPQPIARLMAEIANPKAGESVYDPCFGLGGLLETAGDFIIEDAESLSTGSYSSTVNNTLHGVELSPQAFLIGLIRLILTGFNQPRLRLGDALEQDFYNTRQFDIVLAAPPIGAKIKDSWRYRQYPLKTGSSENLFLQHIMASLKPNGRAVVALPEGTLFRGGADEELRKRLLSEFAVEGVIALPEGSMMPYTSVKSNLVVFRRTEPVSEIWFQEAKAVSRAKTKSPAVFDPEREAKIFRQKELPSLHAWTYSAREIAERNFELVVKRQTKRLDSFFEKLRQHEPDLEIAKLGEIAEIIGGVGYTRRDVFPFSEINSTGTPLIRVTELGKDGKIKPASLFYSEDTIGRVAYSNKRLFLGDLLVSTQGTIGKVGRVDEFNDGAIPAHGITAIRLKTDKVQPLYLIRLLQSQPFQEWLKSHAVGVTVKNIPLREIENLSIPILGDNLQRFVAENVHVNANTIELFLALENRVHHEAASDFLSNPFVKNLINKGFDENDGEKELDVLNSYLLSEIGFHAERKVSDSLEKWFDSLLAGTEKISDALGLPLGMERLALLEFCSNDVRELAEKLNAAQFDETTKESLLSLVEKIRDLIESERERLLIYTPLAAAFEPSVIEANSNSKDVSLRVKNESVTLLRRVRLTDSAGIGTFPIGLLASGQEVGVNFPIPPQPPGVYTVSFRWSGLRIDDEPVSGEMDLSYRVTEKSSNITAQNFGTNPYQVGTSLDEQEDEKLFYGRDKIVKKIQTSLRSEGASTVLLLEGNRRIGKTSILKHLQLPEVLPEWIPIYINFQGAKGSKEKPGVPDEEIFYEITRQIIFKLHSLGFEFEAVEIGKVSSEISMLKLDTKIRRELRPQFDVGNPFELLDIQAEAIKDAIGNKRIVLLLDEFNKIQEGIETGVTSATVPENIRNLFNNHNRISGILGVAKRLKNMRENYWSALFGLGVLIPVGTLDSDSARRLVIEPAADKLTYPIDISNQILELTICQPYFLQSLCHRIFTECLERQERIVSQRILERAVSEMVEDNEHFKEMFENENNHRRRYLICLVQKLSGLPDPVTADLIAEHLAAADIDYDTTDLAEDLKGLEELDVLEHSKGTYKIKIPLFAKWLEQSVDRQMQRLLAQEE